MGATRRVDSVNLPPENLATMAPSKLAIELPHWPLANLQEHTGTLLVWFPNPLDGDPV